MFALGRWLQAQYQQPTLRTWIGPLLLLKLGITVITWLRLTGDAALFQHWSGLLTEQLWTAPSAWLQTLGSDAFSFRGRNLVYHGFSNTFFLIKLLSVVNLLSLGNALLNSLYLSLFCFVGGWQLVRAVEQTLPAAPRGAAIVAFFLWPTVVYWSSGLTKESLLVGSSAWLLALALRGYYGAVPFPKRSVLGVVALAILFFKMRFFFAAVLLGALAALGMVRLVQRLGGARYRWSQVVLMAMVLSSGVWAASEVSPAFRFNKFTNQLIRNYSDLRANSLARPHIEFDNLAPTGASIAQNAPFAIGYALTRPWPWEFHNAAYVAAGLENMALLVLLVVAGVALVQGQGRSGTLPFALVLALLFYCVVLAALLGLSTPNLGTLSRYRVVLLPYLLLLLLQNRYLASWLNRWFR
ncbi:hypothetical protein BXP70_11415 [Hymenobacter crusticola]|uniref:Glycosyltransferase RgtA/B/C/D-like domain-containing protein n=1 Tax=Hymenobacter crusticola TaxID=1770526 RepID=A0A243WF40_9BACT|nr:hypothetical protein BXP70_11415 [Hymenobacter crusticola]